MGPDSLVAGSNPQSGPSAQYRVVPSGEIVAAVTKGGAL